MHRAILHNYSILFADFTASDLYLNAVPKQSDAILFLKLLLVLVRYLTDPPPTASSPDTAEARTKEAIEDGRVLPPLPPQRPEDRPTKRQRMPNLPRKVRQDMPGHLCHGSGSSITVPAFDRKRVYPTLVASRRSSKEFLPLLPTRVLFLAITAR